MTAAYFKICDSQITIYYTPRHGIRLCTLVVFGGEVYYLIILKFPIQRLLTMANKTITWEQFERIELRVGTIIDVADFPEAQKPAYKLTIDFGSEIGVKKSSAQITHLYEKADLLRKQVIGVINFPAKQIGPFRSECLVTGFYRNGNEVVLAVPDIEVPNGSKLY